VNVSEPFLADPLAEDVEGHAGEPFSVQIQPGIEGPTGYAPALTDDFSVEGFRHAEDDSGDGAAHWPGSFIRKEPHHASL
jgi:hypothetical protein